MVNILLPKARSEQRRWRQEVIDAELTMVDPWQIKTLPELAQTRTVWLNLDEYRGVVCVSPTAARVLVNALDQYWPMPPVAVTWLCNGPRTASVLQAAGLPVRFPANGNTAEDVLQLPETLEVTNDKWLIVKGEGGRVTYPAVLTARGASVVSLDVYRREMDEQALQQMPSLAASCDVVWLSSEFLGEQMLQRNRDFWLAWPGQWWLSSTRIQQWARREGLHNTEIANGATPAAMCHMIQQYRSINEAKKGEI